MVGLWISFMLYVISGYNLLFLMKDLNIQIIHLWHDKNVWALEMSRHKIQCLFNVEVKQTLGFLWIFKFDFQPQFNVYLMMEIDVKSNVFLTLNWCLVPAGFKTIGL